MKPFLYIELDDHFLKLMDINYEGLVIKKEDQQLRIPISELINFIRKRADAVWGDCLKDVDK